MRTLRTQLHHPSRLNLEILIEEGCEIVSEIFPKIEKNTKVYYSDRVEESYLQSLMHEPRKYF